MKGNIKGRLLFLFGWLVLAQPAAQAQFIFTTNNGAITITGYTGPGGAVTIPCSTNGLRVTSIGDSAFAYRNLTSVTIPDSVTNIGHEAFVECGLGNLTIPDSVTSIGGEAFFGCGLGNVTIPNSVTNIGDSAFYGSSLASVTIGNGLTSIGPEVFQYCTSLASVTIPERVTGIGALAFANCYGLTNVTIPESVTTIGNAAFQYCSLASVTIPNSVTSIENFAFGYCPLTALSVETNNPAYCSAGGILFNRSQTTLIQYAAGNVATSYMIPSSVTSIGDGAFVGCASLTSVTIPSSVSSIGAYAFQSCQHVTNAMIGNSVTSIGEAAFAECWALTSVFFMGNAPSADMSVFAEIAAGEYAVFYLPGTAGWGSWFEGLRTAPWTLPHPLILAGSPNFGVQTNGFGFTISWATNLSVVVEACTNLANPVWQPLQTNTLTNGWFSFSDPQWTNCPGRFYRIRSP